MLPRGSWPGRIGLSLNVRHCLFCNHLLRRYHGAAPSIPNLILKGPRLVVAMLAGRRLDDPRLGPRRYRASIFIGPAC